MNTFLKITGPKMDLWLVKTVGIILAVIGAVLIFAYVNTEVNLSIILLAIGSALSLAIVEFMALRYLAGKKLKHEGHHTCTRFAHLDLLSKSCVPAHV
ncbi:MAG TPA: hypothetical protein VF918_15620 [Anaerolineales bacterium]